MPPISITHSNNSSSTAHADDDALAAVNFDLSAARAPITAQRKQAIDAEASIERPGIGRANRAVSSAHPNGGEGDYADNLKDYVRQMSNSEPPLRYHRHMADKF